MPIKAGVAAIAILGGSLAAVGGVVVPLKIASVFSAPKAASADPLGPEEAFLPPDETQRVIAHGVRQMLASSGALVSLHEGRPGSPAHIVLWRDGAADRGQVNESEVVVIAHNPLLQTLSAYTHEASGEASPVIGSNDLFSDGLFESWRRGAAVTPRVIATGVTDVRLGWRSGDGGEGELVVRLIWGGEGADEGPESQRARRVAELRVTLPRVQRAG